MFFKGLGDQQKMRSVIRKYIFVLIYKKWYINK